MKEPEDIASDATDSTLRNLLGVAPRPGRIGRFEVLGELGSGGFGVVLRAFDPKLGQERALKVPHLEVLANAPARRRFLDEARSAARLDHPNIVRVFEADDIAGVCYIAMEYCSAGSLADWLKRRPDDRPVPPRWAASLVARIADAVQHVHDRGVHHRDLKPGNILLVPEGDGPATDDARDDDLPHFCPKVADFGLAKTLDDQAGTRTPTGARIGTLAYIAPEQARGDRAAVGPATDVYGLGAILYELLAGRRPFSGSGEAELLHRVLVEDPAPLRQVRGDLPFDLQTICRKCLAKSPGDRYPTAAAVAADLRRFLDGESIRTQPRWRRARAAIRRRPVRSALIGLAILAGAAGVAASTAVVNYKERKDAEAWLAQLEAADIARLPPLVRQRQPDDPRVAPRLAELYESSDPTKKLAAALVLAPREGQCALYAYNQLLSAPPEAVRHIAGILVDRVPLLVDWLTRDVQSSPSPGASDSEREARDLRRANAATALIYLGRHPEPGWQLLRFTTDPQARSFLIHRLVPGGVEPRRIADRLDVEEDPTIRRALIQSLPEASDAISPDHLRSRVRDRLLDLYEHDADAGVHGSAKWMLLRWGSAYRLRAIDDRLAKAAPPGGRGWRIGPLGLTFVTIEDPALDRVVEVSDTEVSVDVFRRLYPDHKYNARASPEAGCPINTVTYYDCLSFCNQLSERHGIPESQWCHHRHGGGRLEPVDGYRDRAGYRLLTEREFEVASRAGSAASRYYGGSDALLTHYAWYLQNSDGHSNPVAGRKPNDSGLFDTLGNVFEWVEKTSQDKGPLIRAIAGASFMQPTRVVRCDYAVDNLGSLPNFSFGFRVARTIRARVAPGRE